MAKTSIKELRKLSKLEREKQIKDLHDELILLRSKNAMGGSLENPSRLRTVRKTIARLKTLETEEKLGIHLPKK